MGSRNYNHSMVSILYHLIHIFTIFRWFDEIKYNTGIKEKILKNCGEINVINIKWAQKTVHLK